MIVLDTTTRKLQAVLGGAVAANQPQATVVYYEKTPKQVDTTKMFTKATNLNSTTDVDILAAPGEINNIRYIKNLTVYNLDTASVSVIIKMDDGGTETILVRQTLLTLESLHYEDGAGWQVL